MKITKMIIALFFIFCITFPARANDNENIDTASIGFDQHIGAQLPATLTLRDTQNRAVALGNQFGHRPLALVLVWYECPNLCNVLLDGVFAGLKNADLKPGRDLDLLIVSIDPDETPAQARLKQQTLSTRFIGANAAIFLSGDRTALTMLQSSIGFRAQYDAAHRQFIHPSGLVMATPSGKITRYLLGVVFDREELINSLSPGPSPLDPLDPLGSAGRGEKIAEKGNFIERVSLRCGITLADASQRTTTIVATLRALCILLFAFLAIVLVRKWRRT
ncbi:MAG TPA: SCO family protein [Spongiibacteraceae bacterium]